MEKLVEGIVDVHTHILPEGGWPDWNKQFGYDGWLRMRITDSSNEGGEAELLRSDGSLFRRITRNCYCPETRIRECNQAGVAIQALSTVPGVGFNYWARGEDAGVVARFLNDHLIGLVRRHPDRFVGLGTVPMQDPPAAIAELRRIVGEGLVGVQIGTHVNDWNLDDPALESFWQAVADLDVPVFIHPWDLREGQRYERHWFPWLLDMPNETAMALGSLLMGGVLHRHPGLRLCFAHGGGSFAALLGRIEHGFQVRPDLCQTACTHPPSWYLAAHPTTNIYVDYLVHDSEALALVIRKFGWDRVVVGTDYPFPLGEMNNPCRIVEEVVSRCTLEDGFIRRIDEEDHESCLDAKTNSKLNANGKTAKDLRLLLCSVNAKRFLKLT